MFFLQHDIISLPLLKSFSENYPPSMQKTAGMDLEKKNFNKILLTQLACQRIPFILPFIRFFSFLKIFKKEFEGSKYFWKSQGEISVEFTKIMLNVIALKLISTIERQCALVTNFKCESWKYSKLLCFGFVLRLTCLTSAGILIF